MQILSRSLASAMLALCCVLGTSTTILANPSDAADTAARDLVAAAEREDWEGVALYAEHVDDPLVTAYAEWLHLQRRNSGASFTEITSFIDRHPTWPRQFDMRQMAERAINEDDSFAVS